MPAVRCVRRGAAGAVRPPSHAQWTPLAHRAVESSTMDEVGHSMDKAFNCCC